MRTDSEHVASPPVVLVVGAGINGAAVARELALNGISVIVVDANDVAFGATSRSSRLIHGGLRYLERGDFALVRESLRERAILLRTAPQFVQPLKLRIPVRRLFGGLVWSALTFVGWERSWFGRLWLRCWPNARERGLWLVRLGLWMYDWLAGPPIQQIKDREPQRSQTQTGAADPLLNSAARWSCEYFDAQILSPERFTVALLDQARQLAQQHELKFEVHTHTRMEIDGEQVRLIDVLGTNHEVTLQPDVIINATGAWGDATLAEWRVDSPRLFGGTKGSHFVTQNRELRSALGDSGIYAEAGDGRMVFVLPFGPAQTLVGTTDEPFDAPPETAVAEPREIDYLVDLVNEVVPSARLSRDDVVMSYSGVRPLPFSRSDSPSAVPRGHWIEENTNGPIPILTLIGGKLTTCRALGQEVVDLVLDRLHVSRRASSQNLAIHDSRLPPDRNLTAPLEDSEIFRSADVVEIIRHEWVRTLSDLVERRLLLIFNPRLTQQDLRQLAAFLVQEGVISANQIDEEVATAVARLRHVYGICLNDAGGSTDSALPVG